MIRESRERKLFLRDAKKVALEEVGKEVFQEIFSRKRKRRRRGPFFKRLLRLTGKVLKVVATKRLGL